MSKSIQRLRQLMEEVKALEGAMAALQNQAAEASGVSVGQHDVLDALMDGAPLTVPQIAKALDNSRQYTQRTVNALLEQGLVESQPNPNHKTSKRYRLSAMGVHAVSDRQKAEAKALADLDVVIKKKQWAQAVDLLQSVRTHLTPGTPPGPRKG